MPVKLYSLPLSPFAARVRSVIYAKNLDIEIVQAPADWTTSADYRALNPLARVPVLVLDDGTTLPESGVIVEYLEDAFPNPPLRPAAAADRARVRLVTQVAELYVTGAMMPLFELHDTPTRDEAAIAVQLKKFDAALAQLERLLVPGRYAFGDRMTTADAWLMPMRYAIGGLMGFAGLPHLIDAYPAIAGYDAVARADPHLGRVWAEMEDGLKAFMTRRAAEAAAGA
jgi:glutathione S-transferase